VKYFHVSELANAMLAPGVRSGADLPRGCRVQAGHRKAHKGGLTLFFAQTIFDSTTVPCSKPASACGNGQGMYILNARKAIT
jgi:hypothetical protein